jgi:hypothetical protein
MKWKKEEGHYEDNKKCKWWIFMNQMEVNKKVSLKRSIKWLFFILQKNNIIRAEKYSMGIKIKNGIH